MLNLKSIFKLLILIFTSSIFFTIINSCTDQDMEYAYKQHTIADKNKDLIKAFTNDFWNRHDMNAFDTYFSDDFKMHSTEGDRSRDEYKQICQDYFKAFPDLIITTNDLIAEGDKVVQAWTSNATQEGEFMGISPTEKRVEIQGVGIFRIEDGRIAELWMSRDNLGLLQQLGTFSDDTKG